MLKSKKMDPYKIKYLMSKIVSGEYYIPRFQREFVWKTGKIVDLLKSIQMNYPIGSLLVSAKNDSKIIRGRNEIIDSVVSGDYKSAANTVIDGQQRLTSIIIAYFAPSLDAKVLNNVITGKSAKTIMQTLRKLTFYDNQFFTRIELIKFLVNNGTSPIEAKKIAMDHAINIPEINEKVRKSIGEIDINIQTLNGWNSAEIIEIFTAINQKTKALTHIDLMNGAMFNASNDGFDLLKTIKDTNVSWKQFGEIPQQLFVQLMKIYSDLNNYPANSINYKPDKLVDWAQNKELVNQFIRDFNNFKSMIIKSFGIIDRKLDIYTLKLIPKEVYLISIFSLLCKLKEGEDNFNKIFNNLVSMITKKLIIGEYASSPNAKAQKDINSILMPAIESNENNWPDLKEEKWEEILEKQLDQLVYKNKNNGIFKIFLATLSSNNPKCLFEKSHVPVRPTEVTKLDTDIHHFIPRKSDTAKNFHLDEKVEGLGNLVLITAKENRNEIRNKNIGEYLTLSKLELGDAAFKEAMESHLFDYDQICDVMKIKDSDSSVKVHEVIGDLYTDRKEVILQKIIEKFIERN